VYNIQKAVSRLDYAPKLKEIKVTDIKKGIGVFTPKPGKSVSFAALKETLKKAGYTLAAADCFLGIVVLILVVAPLRTQSKVMSASSAQLKTQKAFFNKMRKMCGRRFEGATEFPKNADHPMVGKKLVMSVGPCSKKEIRIPFQVGEGKSRTWILTLGEKGLLFKHDHRHGLCCIVVIQR